MMTQPTPLARHYLVFKVGKEEYALNILTVQEIRSYQLAATISNCPDFVKGITKIGEDLATIIDLRILFNITSVTYDALTLMIILKIHDHLFAAVIDEAIDVITAGENEISPADEISTLGARHSIQGILNYHGRLLMVLDSEKLFTQDLLLLASQTKQLQMAS